MKNIILLIFLLSTNFVFSQCKYDAEIKSLYREINQLQNKIKLNIDKGTFDALNENDNILLPRANQKQLRVNKLLKECADEKLNDCPHKAEIERLANQVAQEAATLAKQANDKYSNSNDAANWVLQQLETSPTYTRLKQLQKECGMQPVNIAGDTNISNGTNISNQTNYNNSDIDPELRYQIELTQEVVGTTFDAITDISYINSDYYRDLQSINKSPRSSEIYDGSDIINNTETINNKEIENEIYGNPEINKYSYSNSANNDFSDFELKEDDNKKESILDVILFQNDDYKIVGDFILNNNSENEYVANISLENISAENILFNSPVIVKYKDKYLKFETKFFKIGKSISKSFSIVGIGENIRRYINVITGPYTKGKCEHETKIVKTYKKQMFKNDKRFWNYKAQILVKANNFCPDEFLVLSKSELKKGGWDSGVGYFVKKNEIYIFNIGDIDIYTGKLNIDKTEPYYNDY